MPVENEQIARAQQIRNGLDQLKASLDYDEKKKEIGEIEEQMTAPGFWDDQEKAQVVVSRIKALKALVKPMDEIIKELDELDVFFELGQEDEETAAEIPAKLAEVEKTLQNLQTAALLNGPFDANDAIHNQRSRRRHGRERLGGDAPAHVHALGAGERLYVRNSRPPRQRRGGNQQRVGHDSRSDGVRIPQGRDRNAPPCSHQPL